MVVFAYQYASTNSLITRTSGCTWVSLANGIRDTTGGAKSPTPDQVHRQVKRAEETSPSTPGWSIPDAVLAAHRLDVKLTDHSGSGFGAVLAYLDAGHDVLLQGDSDRFPDGCSGAFDGDHCILAIGGKRKDRKRAIKDPICKTVTEVTEATLKAYAEKLAPRVRFGVFDDVRQTDRGTLSAEAGKYPTYRLVNGTAVRDGTLVTGGWPGADAVLVHAKGVGGGTRLLVRLLSGVHEKTLLHVSDDGLTFVRG